jgi:hypothetical protein
MLQHKASMDAVMELKAQAPANHAVQVRDSRETILYMRKAG